jgi:sugar (pentulose or hexulose) kinase
MDPESAWEAAAAVCRRVLSHPGVDSRRIAAVGVTGVMVGAWLVDRHGRPLRPAILWDDGRALECVERLQQRHVDLMSVIFSRSGSVMQSGCTLPVLRWLDEREPELLGEAAAILNAKDFLRFRLTGVIATDETEAAVAPGSARNRIHDEDLFALFGLERRRRLMPPVKPSTECVGAVTTAAAEATGLLPGTPVVAGAGDTPASVLGAGIGEPGLACAVLGTTSLNGVVTDKPIFEPADLGILFTLPDGLWMKTMVNVAGTTSLDWCLSALCPDLLSRSDPYQALEEIAASARPGAKGVVYVPYLSPSGVVAPRIEPGARGLIAGLTPAHGRAEMVRAIYEGGALAIRDCFAAIDQKVDRIRLVGGGARSPFWSQVIADVTGRPVETPEGTQFGAKGAALLAGVGVGIYGSVREACRETFRVARSHTPDPTQRATYDEAFRLYCACRTAALEGIASAYR